MNKKITVLLAVTTLACLTACKTESYSTNETNVHLTTTKDGETTEKDFDLEVSQGSPFDGSETDTANAVESEGGKYDSEIYELNYFINEDGNLILTAPEADSDWWRMITLDESTKTMEFSDDDIGEDGLYYIEIVPAVRDGKGQAVIGHFTQDSSEEAVDFAIIDVAIEDGKITDITDSGFTADLSVISD